MEEGCSGKGGGGGGGLGLVRDRARGRMLYVGAQAIEAYAALEGSVERGVIGIRARDGTRAADKRRLRSRPSRWGLSVAATSQPAARPALLNTTEPLWTLSTRKVSGTEPPSWAEMYKRTPRREDWSASGRCRSYKRPSPLFSPRPLLKVLQRSSPPPSSSRSRPPPPPFHPGPATASRCVLRLVVFLVAPRPRPYLVLRRRSPA